MLTEKFEIFLALLAGLILLVMGIFLNFTLPAILLRLLIVLVVFYIIGLAVKTYLRKKIFFEPEPEPTEESDEDFSGGEEVLTQANETNEIENNADSQLL